MRIDKGFYGDHHPTPEEIFLLIEISDSSLRFDLQEKAPVYARANIRDYWVFDVNQKQAYIFRNPTATGYQSETIVNVDATVTPLAFPNLEIALSEIFLP